MRALRRLWRAVLRAVGLGPKTAAERGGPGFSGILEATMADVPDIVRLELPIFRAHEAAHPIDFPERTADRALVEKYEALIDSNSAGVAIYVADGRAVGFISWATYSQQGMTQAAIQTIAVDPAYRRRRIATELLEYMRKHLADAGIAAVRAHVWAQNDGSRAFFEKHGFRASFTLYSAPLERPGIQPPGQ